MELPERDWTLQAACLNLRTRYQERDVGILFVELRWMPVRTVLTERFAVVCVEHDRRVSMV